ncbi:SDR family NAD(P)-dependent oxidoreductase [Streptomyces sp. NPDC006487]|uniref:SDR family NAD(P)-dependent oxidoreductase n=1 Tax=Streptomyces sp. NPDC006487 TaxID=3364748 RepID=UPI0036AF6C3B
MPSSLSGRTVLVTGATSGIGYETARQLAERGATVLLHGRTPDEAQAAADRLITTAGIGATSLRQFAADFAHLDEVESLAYAVVREHPRLDVLVNNAAIAAPERHTVTADGNEIAFQVNFLAHYLLTNLLDAALTTDPGGRVINVSSSLHRTGTIMWNDPQRPRRYARLAAYAQSQLALTDFAAGPLPAAGRGRVRPRRALAAHRVHQAHHGAGRPTGRPASSSGARRWRTSAAGTSTASARAGRQARSPSPR